MAHSLPSTPRQPSLIDPLGRAITYMRVSVTDRCDLRCLYCMSESMTFLPKKELLTLEELSRLCRVFVGLGLKKVRITGGEPLVRRGIMALFRALASMPLQELTLTTNGTQLGRYAKDLYGCGVRRVNVSLDTLNPVRFRQLTRGGDVHHVISNIDEAAACGLAIKINVVALRGINDHESDAMIRWCAERGYDLTFIEVMPMGEVASSRHEQFVSLDSLYDSVEKHWRLQPAQACVAPALQGPARRYWLPDAGIHVGFITPLSHHFCDTCNRVRLTCTGKLYMCLAHEDHASLRDVLRASPPDDDTALVHAIQGAIARKPSQHDFVAHMQKSHATLTRHMNVTGG
ncbi:MAG: GTP 3',8-cyclase MoaA [Alphaproteobacteria bacterium GM7ARS4]|nr:GTP 3',8-cyclase MoaA [Alphaproteobacteria bacterium GM7ARS4]